MMEHIGYISEEELYLRQERCETARKKFVGTLCKRLVIMAVLLWSVIRSGMPRWAVLLMAAALIVNLTGLLPLWQEWRQYKKELQEVLSKME